MACTPAFPRSTGVRELSAHLLVQRRADPVHQPCGMNQVLDRNLRCVVGDGGVGALESV